MRKLKLMNIKERLNNLLKGTQLESGREQITKLL